MVTVVIVVFAFHAFMWGDQLSRCFSEMNSFQILATSFVTLSKRKVEPNLFILKQKVWPLTICNIMYNTHILKFSTFEPFWSAVCLTIEVYSKYTSKPACCSY